MCFSVIFVIQHSSHSHSFPSLSFAARNFSQLKLHCSNYSYSSAITAYLALHPILLLYPLIIVLHYLLLLLFIFNQLSKHSHATTFACSLDLQQSKINSISYDYMATVGQIENLKCLVCLLNLFESARGPLPLLRFHSACCCCWNAGLGLVCRKNWFCDFMLHCIIPVKCT